MTMRKWWYSSAIVLALSLVAVKAAEAQPGCRSYAALKGSDGNWHCTVFDGVNCVVCPPVE